MTIKRRLFVSNILMIVVPVLLSMAALGVGVSAVMRLAGFENDDFKNSDRFGRAYLQIQTLAEKWSEGSSPERIRADAEQYYGQYAGGNLVVMIFQGETLIYGSGSVSDTSLIDMAVMEMGSHSYQKDATYIVSYDAGNYKALLVDTSYFRPNPWQMIDYRQAAFIGFMIMLLLIGIILITNRFLTRLVFRSIVTPLDTLVYGVHQIRDGNLDYRIAYKGRDEFAQVCADFNEMAARLLDMVNARQKDDENRRELIAGISHDLRTPLTSIKAYVEGLEKGVADNPQMQRTYLDTIKSKTNDLEHIVAQLFLFSKLDIGEFPFNIEPIDIGLMISDYVAMTAPEYQDKNLELSINVNVWKRMVLVDTVQLRNVFTNLLENTLKYNGQQNKMMRISCMKDDGCAKITFTDNGPGVSPDALDKLFNAFYRGDKARTKPSQGSGLGLAISAKIVERFDGTIRAYNSDKGGLAVEISLPIQTGGQVDEENTDC